MRKRMLAAVIGAAAMMSMTAGPLAGEIAARARWIAGSGAAARQVGRLLGPERSVSDSSAPPTQSWGQIVREVGLGRRPGACNP
jgi:hypothetical protein